MKMLLFSGRISGSLSGMQWPSQPLLPRASFSLNVNSLNQVCSSSLCYFAILLSLSVFHSELLPIDRQPPSRSTTSLFCVAMLIIIKNLSFNKVYTKVHGDKQTLNGHSKKFPYARTSKHANNPSSLPPRRPLPPLKAQLCVETLQ